MAQWNKDQWGAQQGQGYVPFYANGGQPNPGYSQPYAQSVSQPQYDPQASEIQKSPFEDGRFQPKKRINDIFFLIFFILQFVGFVVLSVIALSGFVSGNGGGGLGNGQTGSSVTLNRHTIYLLLFVTAAGLVLSLSYLMLARMFTRALMHITLVLSIILNMQVHPAAQIPCYVDRLFSGICIYYWITGYYSGAIIFTIIALFSIFAYFGFRSRIPLASLLLQVVMDVSKHHKSVYVVAFIALILQAALSVYTKWTPGGPSCGNGSSCSGSTVAGLVFYAVFSYLWTSQVIGNVALATLAGGAYGNWYYFGPRDQGQMPKHPTLGAFGRASTLSLGSIAFGSLIVTILEIIRLILNAVRNNANAQGSFVEACLACCAEFFVGCIEGLVRYFNRYAYIEIALYGKPYLQAAKNTWTMFKDRGIDALVNDSLVGMTLMWGAYVIGLLCSLFGYLYLRRAYRFIALK
ncbi:hypothetical protein AZE42_01778 [Rhizopogon vesiculosus]|uniref:Protein PNS1 n=1 Tax=Rhizopogon vesiculosus TaxID=180088 RepID=A0A1J8QYP8_9AGAM|nr:hypothetical protein AZE42_01778 [Rhizopogon vesiculosus]